MFSLKLTLTNLLKQTFIISFYKRWRPSRFLYHVGLYTKDVRNGHKEYPGLEQQFLHTTQGGVWTQNTQRSRERYGNLLHYYLCHLYNQWI